MTIDAGLPSTIEGLAHAFRSGVVTSEQVTTSCLEAVAERDPVLRAFIEVFHDEALQQARHADAELRRGHDRGPLHGVPVALKDLIDVAGRRTTAASRVRERHVAAADAAIVLRLREAGAVLIGKNNLHEFALGTTNEDSAFGPARHPADPARSPGGSSGGSAAAVAAGMARAAIGTDTGGSVRIPASICGLVGLKPAYGDISLRGVVPLSTTLDHAGPICRTVADARSLFGILSGQKYERDVGAETIRGHRFAILRGYFDAVVDPDVAAVFAGACRRLRDAGAAIDNVEIGHTAEIASVYIYIALTEAAAYHARALQTQPRDYTPNVRLRLEMGRYMLGEDYVRARHGAAVLRAEVDAVLRGRDGLLLPTVPIPAPKLGAETVRVGREDYPVRNVMLRLTQLFNITGHPAITLPCGTVSIPASAELPVGAQLVGQGDTFALLDAAAAIEPYLGPGTSR
jgi:aspartyl-tRNA(Asn)/glutamyl-tRNA(Gln) amidotransferase subunit A